MNKDRHIPKFVLLERQQQKHFLETLIFSSEEKLTLNIILNIITEKDSFFGEKVEGNDESEISKDELAKGLSEEEFDEMMLSRFALNQKYIKLLIDEINIELETTNRPFRIVDFAGGYQFSTLNEYGELVASVVRAKSKKRISNVQLETLAIIAYKQPVTKPEIEQIRGVNSKEAVNSLIDKGFVSVVGRSEKVGKPLLYGTTPLFLESFGLNSLKDLPNLKELNELTSDAPTEEDLQQVRINPTTMENEDNTESAETTENQVEVEDKENDDELSDMYIPNK